MTTKEELLSKIDEVISEIERLTKDDEEFIESGKSFSRQFESDVGDCCHQNSYDFDRARIDTACLWVFLMLNDCDNYEHYQAVTPSWIKEWYNKAEVWNYSPDGARP